MSRETLSPEEKLQSVESLIAQRPEVAGFQSYEYFRNDEHAQRAAFMSGEQENLSLDYPELTSGRVLDLADKTQQALLGLMSGNKSEKTEALYDAVEYRYSEMFLVSLAARMNDASVSDAEQLETIEWFKDTNEALYGKPEPEVFQALAAKHIGSLLEPSHAEGSLASRFQAELVGLLGTIEQSDYRPFVADSQTVERIQSLVTERFEMLVDHIDSEKEYAKDEIVDALNIALQKLGGHEYGWRAEMVPNSSALAVSAHQRLVEVGENRKAILGAELRGKVMHEVGIHALRSMNAERAGWLSAAYGQEGYLPFEEALATALEDAYKGKFVDHGVDYYLIAGLAYGQDNHEPRDMRQVFEILWRTNALKASANAEITDEQIQKAKSKAFTNCMRMFRGTTTVQKGVIYSKDLAYFAGQELAWSVLNKVQTQDDFELLLAGKLDLTRDAHVEIAKNIVRTNNETE